MDPVVMINPVEVSEENEIPFLERWIRCTQELRRRPGFISIRLHRAVDASQRFRFVMVQQWQSEDDARNAIAHIVAKLGDKEFPYQFHPGVFRVFSH